MPITESGILSVSPGREENVCKFKIHFLILEIFQNSRTRDNYVSSYFSSSTSRIDVSLTENFITPSRTFSHIRLAYRAKAANKNYTSAHSPIIVIIHATT